MYLTALLLPNEATLMDVLAAIRAGRPPSDDLVTLPEELIALADAAVGSFLYDDRGAETIVRCAST